MISFIFLGLVNYEAISIKVDTKEQCEQIAQFYQQHAEDVSYECMESKK